MIGKGHGGSSGKPSEAGLIRDARAAYDFASSRYSAKRIVLFGESLGAAVAIALAAERVVAGLILDKAGRIFGTTEYGGNSSGACNVFGCGVVFEITP